jgi:hypothetical protein
MSADEQRRCYQRQAELGRRPCYMRPAIHSNYPKGQPVTPCEHCKDSK